MDAGIYINCPFIPQFLNKARELHLIKPWGPGVDEPS